MSLPKCIIESTITRQPASQQSPSVACEAIAIQKFQQTVEEILQLAEYSNGVFTALCNKSTEISARLESVKTRLANVGGRVEDLPDIMKKQAGIVDRIEWKQARTNSCNFFVPETENAEIKKVYELCDAGPDLQSLDVYRKDGEWKRMMTIQEAEKKLRQRARKSLRSSKGKADISEIRVKKYNSEGDLLKEKALKEPPLPKKSTISGPPKGKLPTRSGSIKKPKPEAIAAQSMPLITTGDDLVEAPRSGLMNAIKSRQFKLRKTEPGKKRGSFGNEVAAILSRRAALEMSSDSEDDEEWI